MNLSIIIVNWNSKDYLQKCISSILSFTSDLDFEIVVIDNASYDGVDKMLNKCYPQQVRFIQSDKNLGFAKANNVAFKATNGNHILFLNPDTELIGPAINILFDYLQILPQAGAVGCKLFNADGTIQTSCIQSYPTIINQLLDSELLRSLFPKSFLWGMASLFGAQDEPVGVEVISGACLMMKRSIFEQVEFFSEDYFMYAEDLDLCYKINRSGFTNYFIPSASVTHLGGGSSEKRPSDFSVVMMRESIFRFMKKNLGVFYGLAYRASTMISAIARLILLLILLPLQYLEQRGSVRDTSLKKWWVILIWSLGIKFAESN